MLCFKSTERILMKNKTIKRIVAGFLSAIMVMTSVPEINTLVNDTVTAEAKVNYKKIYRKSGVCQDAISGEYIYINNDDIPELYLFEYNGECYGYLYTIYRGKVCELAEGGDLNISYKKKGNRFYACTHHVGIYGNFNELDKIKNGESYTYLSWDDVNPNTDPMHFYYNNKKISKKAYYSKDKKIMKKIKNWTEAEGNNTLSELGLK